MPAKIIHTQQHIDQVKELFDQLLGSRAIAKIIGIPRHQVIRIYKILGIYNSGRKPPRTAFLATEKKCATCNDMLSVDLFRKRVKGDRISYESSCLECEKEYKQTYYDENTELCIASVLKSRENNKENFNAYQKQYREDNKVELQVKANIKRNHKRKIDPAFKLRTNISNHINTQLKKNGGSKNGKSIIKGLPYSINELRSHLEALFEPWMKWENHGRYVTKDWNDNDQSTWKWNIDHIKPCASFNYTTMDDLEFQQCWALINLRPYSAKQNIIDSDRIINNDMNKL